MLTTRQPVFKLFVLTLLLALLLAACGGGTPEEATEAPQATPADSGETEEEGSTEPEEETAGGPMSAIGEGRLLLGGYRRKATYASHVRKKRTGRFNSGAA